MKEQHITIEIDRDGRITADAEGFSGDACLRDLDRLLEGLGAGVATVERKPDTPNDRVAQRSTHGLGRKR
ncbi:DUF2997 domain-containing protein [Paraliomyxa miuraensis]|uniref:DUF2997 domain-containing protein n=1 Tax=Paraliomyxa miuraensis TaxID=376150 RepID=UPI00225A0EA8|nr:DUF2997 domain-containing protein [Paraliomyxa miuraensis]MCX4242517.1 DUF2997 domain-containing protein [Paraliomyxa miuraensis]